jgi:hypothetical protein
MPERPPDQAETLVTTVICLKIAGDFAVKSMHTIF